MRFFLRQTFNSSLVQLFLSLKRALPGQQLIIDLCISAFNFKHFFENKVPQNEPIVDMQMRAVGFALQSKSESAHIARLKSFNFIQLNLNF